jgi:hypothetical protein
MSESFDDWQQRVSANVSAAMANEGREKLEAEKERLRDQFAMAALTGILAADPERYRDPQGYWAKEAYAFADEMLKTREGE